MSSPRMTKDQLKDALSDIGVKTGSKMKKDELVKLYRQHVLEQQISNVSASDSLIGGFSSDEEEVQPMDTSYINKETNIADLTNDEIFFKLKDLGEPVGPILDSTRTIYERRLSKILTGDDVPVFSADEDDEENEKETETTDEYEIQSDNPKSNGKVQSFDDDDGQVKSFKSFHERVEESNGNVVRIRKAQSVRTFTSETVNGKTFVPPPPKKRNFVMLGGIAVAVIILVAFLIWLKLDTIVVSKIVPSPSVPVKPQTV